MTVELLLTVPARLWNFFQYASIQRIVIQRIVIVFLGYVFSEWGPKRVLENALSTAFCTRALYPCARVQNCVPAGMRASAPRCDRLQARRRTALLPTISTFAIDLRAPFAARLDARALRRSCARTLKLWPARARSSTMALSARACCAGAAAKAPTQRVARRNRRRMWCLGLRLDAHGGGRGDGSYLCSTPS